MIKADIKIVKKTEACDEGLIHGMMAIKVKQGGKWVFDKGLRKGLSIDNTWTDWDFVIEERVAELEAA